MTATRTINRTRFLNSPLNDGENIKEGPVNNPCFCIIGAFINADTKKRPAMTPGLDTGFDSYWTADYLAHKFDYAETGYGYQTLSNPSEYRAVLTAAEKELRESDQWEDPKWAMEFKQRTLDALIAAGVSIEEEQESKVSGTKLVTVS